MEERGVPLRLEHFANETVQFLKNSEQFLDVRITYASRSNPGENGTKPIFESGYNFVVSVEVSKLEKHFLGIKINRIFSNKGSYGKHINNIFSSAGFRLEESDKKDWQWMFVNKAGVKIYIKPALSLSSYGFIRCFFLVA